MIQQEIQLLTKIQNFDELDKEHSVTSVVVKV